jgi:hypothetical protein
MTMRLTAAMALLLIGCATGPARYDDGAAAATGTPKPVAIDADGRAHLSAHAGRERRQGKLEDYPERPMLAEGFKQAWAMFEVCVSRSGLVQSISIQRPPGNAAMIDQWMTVIRSWRYQPYESEDGPRAFCYPQRLEVKRG